MPERLVIRVAFTFAALFEKPFGLVDWLFVCDYQVLLVGRYYDAALVLCESLHLFVQTIVKFDARYLSVLHKRHERGGTLVLGMSRQTFFLDHRFDLDNPDW